jgi:protoheme IX farnesyltransferase
MALAAVRAAGAVARVGARERVREFCRLVFVLGKARVVGLVTFTALVGTVVAAGGRPAPPALLAIFLIGLLAGGGAGALNHVLDRDIDRRMSRTRTRPLAILREMGLDFGMRIENFPNREELDRRLAREKESA